MDDSLANNGIPFGLLSYFPALLKNDHTTVLADLLAGRMAPEALSSAEPERMLSPSGIPAARRAVHLLIQEIRNRIGSAPAISAAGASIRYFRDGHAFTSWNRGATELSYGLPEAVIVTFGAERVLNIRNRTDPSIQFSLVLQDNSVILTRPALIRDWQIRIPKMSAVTSPTGWLVLHESGDPEAR